MPITLFINNTAGNNTTINPLGNQVTVNLNPAVHLDNKKRYVLRIISAQIPYCFPNVFTGINDNIYYTYKGNPFTMTFPQGIYSLSAINDEMIRQTNDLNNAPYLIFKEMWQIPLFTLYLMIRL